FACVLVLMMLRVPIAYSLLSGASSGIFLLYAWPEGGEFNADRGVGPLLATLSDVPYSFAHSYELATIPLYIALGNLAHTAGITTDLFYAMNMLLRRIRGGVAMASILGCGRVTALTKGRFFAIISGYYYIGMNTNWGKIVEKLFYGTFVLLFFWVGFKLFLIDYIDFDDDVETVQTLPELRVMFPDHPLTLDPVSVDPGTRQRLVNIYEALVKPDADLKMRPALATNWGLIDDRTWEFSLRKNVKFHNTSVFDVMDVVASITRMQEHEDSELKELLTSIEELEVIDDYTLRIKTFEPDPLLLQRLSMVLILPSELAYLDEINDDVGTGSYRVVQWNEEDSMIFERFDDYWGQLSKFERVSALGRVNPVERVNVFAAGEADILVAVPHEVVGALQEKGFVMNANPSLELQFLLFNFDYSLGKNKSFRKAVSLAVDQSFLADGEFVHTVKQFVSAGVFGFNPRIAEHEFDLEKAGDFVDAARLNGRTVKIHLFKNLKVLGEELREKLSEIGLKPIISYLELEDYLHSLEKGKSDIFFVGFRGDLGDSADFFDQAVKSGAAQNFANFEKDYVDELIAEASMELDSVSRRNALQKVMKAIVEDELIGVPLFEYDLIYAFRDLFDAFVRVDNVIYFDEIKLKQGNGIFAQNGGLPFQPGWLWCFQLRPFHLLMRKR
ncbi:TRAP transporter large permease subunit, partial [Candidatus Gracilibacteria bacterium]|nr:TRAP transporter large permease subunit [Candidatus Gracilibacteria bacterium]